MSYILYSILVTVLLNFMQLHFVHAQQAPSSLNFKRKDKFSESHVSRVVGREEGKRKNPFYGAKGPFNKPVLHEMSVFKEPRRVYIQGREAVIYPNMRIHPSDGMTQTEMSIITHPTNPDIVFAGSNAIDPTLAIRTKGWYYSTNGGASWTGSDTLPPQDISTYTSDPVVGIDRDGNLFFNALRYKPLSSVFVTKSSNNGNSWNQINVVDTNSGDLYDKNHLTIDINAGSPYENYLYTAFHFWTQNSCDYPSPTLFSRSTDRGESFSVPITISGSIGNHTIGVNVAVGPNGEIYSTWTGYDSWCSKSGILLGFNRSIDGGKSWGEAKKIRDINGLSIINKGGNSIGAHSFPSMAVDRSNGPRRGWIYIVYSEKAPTTPDIFLISSTDSGATWSAPKRVNQDNSNNDQFQPWMSVDPATGALYVVYFDSRNFPTNDSAQVYISASVDGGNTFGDILVSDVPFLPKPIVSGVTYMGDYIGISALNGIVWPCWNDDRNGIHQAYASRIVFTDFATPLKIVVSSDSIDFGDSYLSSPPNTFDLALQNVGFRDTLLVTDIHSDNTVFVPEIKSLKLPAGAVQTVRVSFMPASVGLKSGKLTITNNDTTHPTVSIILKGNARAITPALSGVLYAAQTGQTKNSFYTIGTNNGAVISLGSLGVSEIRGLAIHTTTKEVYGTVSTPMNTFFYRINCDSGSAIYTQTIPVGDIRAIAFNAGDTLYGATSSGKLYRINLSSGEAVLVGTSTDLNYWGLSFSPISGTLWAAARNFNDSIYIINPLKGSAKSVGTIGLFAIPRSIAFDPKGVLYCLIDNGSGENNLATLDTLTGVATLVSDNPLSVNNLSAIAMRSDFVTSISTDRVVQLPTIFSLQQNYPNPFNPSTMIRFQIPQSPFTKGDKGGFVMLKIYDLLGREVETLVNEEKPAGSYEVTFDRKNLSSGIYFYKLQSGNFVETKRMLMIK